MVGHCCLQAVEPRTARLHYDEGRTLPIARLSSCTGKFAPVIRSKDETICNCHPVLDVSNSNLKRAASAARLKSPFPSTANLGKRGSQAVQMSGWFVCLRWLFCEICTIIQKHPDAR